MEASEIAICIHGRADDGDPRTVWSGGLHENLRDAIGVSLERIGFKTSTDHHMKSRAPGNICNRGRLRAGVQLELPRSLRNTFFNDEGARNAFSSAVRDTIVRETVHPRQAGLASPGDKNGRTGDRRPRPAPAIPRPRALLIVRPTTSAFPAARDHLNPANDAALRIKRRIKSGHKPYLLQEIRLARPLPKVKVRSEQRLPIFLRRGAMIFQSVARRNRRDCPEQRFFALNLEIPKTGRPLYI